MRPGPAWMTIDRMPRPTVSRGGSVVAEETMPDMVKGSGITLDQIRPHLEQHLDCSIQTWADGGTRLDAPRHRWRL